MDDALKAAFAQQGVTVTPVVAAPAGSSAPTTDLTVKYTDYWHWDLVMYLRKLEISLWDPRAGTMMVQGRWENSPLHEFPNAALVTKELVDEIFIRLKAVARPVASATGN
ncbi:hypothetical protein [Methylibium sp.]|uniref:hypothetical protein n=1 Tax=Methylibium sp. TaxID=2067992 RepID=UPI0017F65800|nr:hypothetical protein [Methylibium sp.]MBA3588709.1 hypothetical protein [Methylibium sp.]